MATSELTTFICLFHSSDRAEAALTSLESAGFNRSSITSTWKDSSATQAQNDSYDYTEELTRIGAPARDLDHLKDGLRKGGVVISLDAPENRSDEIEKIFHHFSAEKIDETDVENTTAAPFVAPVAPVSTRSNESVLAAEGAVVPVVEEDLLVGKREVDRGGVRVFRRVVEEPVSESVSLHEEHVVIERRPVDRAVTNADFNAGDKVIELTETEEVPVVSKVSRVVEEVRVGVVESDRTETVRDTVRHTEVEVENVAGTTTGTATDTLKNDRSF
ncbi:MAG: YsnF/AvaK domain-containing protein [Janthinobacterium lividum]